MPSFTNDDAVLDGDTLRLIASAEDDTLTLTGPFVSGAATTGVIDGGTGADTLILDEADLTGTTLAGIERTEIAGEWYVRLWRGLDLEGASRLSTDHLAQLGEITLTGAAATVGRGGFVIDGSTSETVFLTPNLGAGQSLIIAGSDDPTQTLHLDVSQGSYVPGSADPLERLYGVPSPSGLTFVGGAGTDHVTGGSGNDIFYNLGAGDVVYGRAADDSFYLEDTSGAVIRAGAGNDLLRIEGAQVHFSGGDGDDFVALDDVLEGSILRGGAGYDTLYVLGSSQLLGVEIDGFERIVSDRGPSLIVDATTLSGLRGITFDGEVNLNLQDVAHQTLVFDWTINRRFLATTFSEEAAEGMIGVTIDLRNLVRPTTDDYNDVIVAVYEQSTILGSSGADRFGGWVNAVDATVYGYGGTDVFDIGHDRTTVYGGRDGDYFNIFEAQDGQYFGGEGWDIFYLFGDISGSKIRGGQGPDSISFGSNGRISVNDAQINGIEHAHFQTSMRVDIDADHLNDLGRFIITDEPEGYRWSDDTSTTANIIVHDMGNRSERLKADIADGYSMQLRLRAEVGEAVSLDLTRARGGEDSQYIIRASQGDDTITGSRISDELSGNRGSDDLHGRGGDDILDGGRGTDILRDGQGRDTLTGGAGRDTFVLTKDATRDSITDFDITRDTLDLRAYDLADISEVRLRYTGTDAVLRIDGEALVLEGLSSQITQDDLSLLL